MTGFFYRALILFYLFITYINHSSLSNNFSIVIYISFMTFKNLYFIIRLYFMIILYVIIFSQSIVQNFAFYIVLYYIFIII